MTEFILAATGALYGWLLTYLLHSTVLLLAVWGLVRVRWVRHPATQDVLWKVALLGGIVTATVTTVRDAPRRHQEPQTVAVQAVHPSSTAHSTPGAGVARWLKGPVTATGAGPAVVAQVTRPSESCRTALTSLPDDHSMWPTIVREACPTPRAFLWQHGVALLWLLGALLTGAALVFRRLAVRDALGVLGPAGPRCQAALERVTASGNRLPIRLATSETSDAPCVVNGTTIVLPDLCEDQLSDDELDAVVAHELAHVQRRDIAWLLVMRAVEHIFWLQPLNLVGVAGALEATELECDDQAVERTGRPLGLARSLARVAEWSLMPRKVRSEIALLQGKGRGLSVRVGRILSPRRREKKPSRWTPLAAAFLVVAPAFMLPSVPGAPVVHRAILYELDAADGNEPTLMLLGGVADAVETPEAAESTLPELESGREPVPPEI